MEKNNLTPEESLSIISRAIMNFRLSYRESSKIFLLWGWIFTLASFSNFIILKILHDREAYHLMGFYSLGIWIGLALAGFVIQYLMIRKMEKANPVYSYLESYVKNLWIVTAVSFGVAMILCFRLGIDPPPVMLLIAGLATTTTGILIKFRPLIIGGMTFFLFSVATTFVSNENIALVTGVAIIVGYLVPGYFLKSAKEPNHV